MKSFNNRQHRGFTLIELMVVIVIVAVLSAAVIPSYKRSMANNLAAMYTNQLLADLNYTRNLSINEANNWSGWFLTNWEWNGNVQRGWFIYSTMSGERRRYQFKTDQSAINTGITINYPYVYFLNCKPYPGYGPYVFTIKPPNCTSGYIINISVNGDITKQSSAC